MNKLLIGAMAALFVAGVATPVSAYSGEDNIQSATQDKLNEIKSRAEQKANDVRSNIDAARTELKETRQQAKDIIRSQKEQIELRRTELKQQIESARSKRTSELTDKRLALCKQRQEKINELMAAGAKVGRERLTHIQNVEARVKEFYSSKNLSNTEYDAALILVDEKEALAVAVVELTESQKFECEKVDGNKPSGEIKLLHDNKHAALNDYRDSVKQLIQIVKAAAQAAKASDGGAS